jgi:hypothetical protein
LAPLLEIPKICKVFAEMEKPVDRLEHAEEGLNLDNISFAWTEKARK